jgi:hypothetical protein
VRRPLIVLSLVLALGAACSSDGDGDTTATTRRAAATTTAATSSPASVAAGCPDQPDSAAGSPPPNQGAALTDGMFFGYITALDAEDLKLTFDAAQLLTGEAAAKAAAEDGGEASDFWSRNSSKATRTLPLAEDAVVCISSPQDIVTNREVSLPQLNQALGDGEPMAVWIDVRQGTAVRVQQQYFP